MAISSDAQKYLNEVWGYDRVEDVDPLTWDCIKENCPEFPLDVELVDAYLAILVERSELGHFVSDEIVHTEIALHSTGQVRSLRSLR